MPDFERLAALPLFDNSLLAWSIAGAIALGVFFALLIVRRAVRSYLRKARTTPQTEFLEIPVQVLSRTTAAFFFVLAIYLGIQALTIAPGTQRILQSAITIALFWQAGLWAVEGVAAWLERKRRRSMTTDRAAVGSIGIIGFRDISQNFVFVQYPHVQFLAKYSDDVSYLQVWSVSTSGL